MGLTVFDALLGDYLQLMPEIVGREAEVEKPRLGDGGFRADPAIEIKTVLDLLCQFHGRFLCLLGEG